MTRNTITKYRGKGELLNKKFFGLVMVFVASATLALSSCGGGKPPATSPAAIAPPAGAPATVKGKAVDQFFTETCSACHGAKREGSVGPALMPQRLTQADDFYGNIVKNGRPGTAMAGFPDLSDNDIKALVNFIKYTEPK